MTSDYAEQLNVLGSGAYRISAREFREEYLLTKKQIAQRSERLARGLGRNELGGRLQDESSPNVIIPIILFAFTFFLPIST